MRIDQKYFYPFIIGVALVCAGLIAYFSLSQAFKKGNSFLEAIGDGQTLYHQKFRIPGSESDSLSASHYRGSYVLMDFWSPWSNRSTAAHVAIFNRIMSSQTPIVVFSPAVKDTDQNIIQYAESVMYPFIYVDGTEVYQDEIIPGVPAYLLFSPEGELLEAKLGFSNPSDLDFLRDYLE